MRFKRDERGAAAVELALVLPMLILIVFGIAECGFIFNRWISVTHSARDGVRRYALGETAAAAEASAEAASPDLGPTVACTASEPAIGEVQMFCETTYDLSLYFFDTPIALQSTALMRKE